MTTNPTLRRVPKAAAPVKPNQADLVRIETERLRIWLESWAASMCNDYSAVQNLAGGSSTTLEGREAATNYMVAEDDTLIVNDLRSKHILHEISDAIDSLMEGKMWAWWTIYRFHGLRRQAAGVWTFAGLEADLPGAYARAVEELRQVVNRRGIVL